MAVTQTQSPWTYTSPMELPLAARGLNSSGSESSIDSGFESPLGSGKGSESPVARTLNMLVSLYLPQPPFCSWLTDQSRLVTILARVRDIRHNL